MAKDKIEFVTIREAAKRGPFKECALRKMTKKGIIPGMYCGNTFYVNYARYLEVIDVLSVQSANCNNLPVF